MANPKSGSSVASNNYNLLTNNEKFIKNKEVKTDLLNQARKSVFETLNLDATLVNRATLANRIWKNRNKPLKVPTWKMELRLEDPKFEVNLDERLNKHTDLKIKYEAAVNKWDTNALKFLDTEFAERLILDVWGSIEFKPTDNENFIRGKDAKEESEIAYNSLNELAEYAWKIELVTRFLDSWEAQWDNYYVIKWQEKWIKKVRKKYNELLKAEGGDEKKDNEKKDDEKKDDEKKDSELASIMRERMERMDKKDRDLEELRRQNEEQNQRIKELEEKLNNRDTNTANESENPEDDNDDTNEGDSDIDENIDTGDSIDNVENIDENSNFISRSSVETQIVRIRGSRGYPTWTITIRGEVIHIEEFEFYEEFKQEYIEARWNTEIISRLDKEFSEMIILFSPIWSDYEHRYCIGLTELELNDGLYVSEERLAHYGVRIDVQDYFEQVVESEVIRRRRIVERLETTITDLQTSIVELTRSISIRRFEKEVILKEIKSKKATLKILIAKYRKILVSLRWIDNNDEDLKRLRGEEARLQKEYDALLKEKEKQDALKKEIDDIKKRIEELENSGNNGETGANLELQNKINWKKKEVEEIKDRIKEIEAERDECKWKLDRWTVTGEELVTLRENIRKCNIKIDKLNSDLKKLEDEIKELESQLEWDDKIVKIEKEIVEKKAEREKLSDELSKLTAEHSLYVRDLRVDENGKIVAGANESYEDDEIRLKRIEEIENELKIKDEEIKKLEEDLKKEKEKWNNWADENAEEIKKLKERLAELEGQLDPDIDKKLAAKKKELDEVKKQIKERLQNWNKSELEIHLIEIIEERESLLIELETLEATLIKVKTKEERIEIKEKISIINKRLKVITQTYTRFEEFVHIYREKITTRKWTVYRITPIWGPTPQWLELNSVISDMGTDVFREKAALKVEEEIKRQYDRLWWWQLGSRLALFLGRWSRRKRMMRGEMNGMARTAFQTGAWYATLNDQSQNAADRHGHELLTNMAAVNRITTVHNPQVDQLCRDYLNNVVNDTTFQNRFNAIVDADTNIQSILIGNNITHIWTNILLQLKEQKALNALINTLNTQLNQYIATSNPVYMNNMQNYVEQYIKDYQRTPAFMTTFENFVRWNLNARNQLRRYLSHQKAIMNMQITNLRMNIDILNRWESAYQIDNKDRENGWKYKLWHFLDKHPRGTAIWTAALSVWLWLATAPLWAVAWAAVTTWVFGSYVWFTNYIKKWTHHTKEQNTHEKNVVTDYRNEQAKIQNWQNDALNGSLWRKYKAKRQLALYDQTTQENIQLSNQISEYITNLSAKTWPLTPNEDNFMRLNLIEWWARLKYYRAMWHNFLASENVDKTEEDMKRLEKAITLWLQKIGQTTNNIETTMSATNNLGTNITYAVIQKDLKASYDKSLIQFKRERRNLALKYGISTAALSIGTALWMQYITGTWVFAKSVPGTPPTPPSWWNVTSYAWWTDNFTLWWEDLTNWTVYNTTKSAISSSGAPSGSQLTFNYWVWTDWTNVVSSFNPLWKFNALRTDFSDPSLYPNLSRLQRFALRQELRKIITDPSFVSAFKDADLARMRAMESIEHFARALNDSVRPDLILKFNHTGSIPGLTPNTWVERFMTWAIDIVTPKVPWTPWTPGIPAKTWWRWLMWVPLFFNTFKKRKPTKDTTDQNFWQWNNQPIPQQPNQQPQPNQP